MPPYSNSRFRCGLLAFGVSLAFLSLAQAQSPAASQLPATAPTSPAAQPAPIAATPVSAAENIQRRRARVTYQAGLLEVQANNSSLNGILRDIAHATGMKITGGVAEQRVFGNYGPAAPSTILATLLDGTGINMVIHETASNGPAELVLSPRGGGPTPPGPSMADAEYDREEYAGSVSQPAQVQQQPAPAQGFQTAGGVANPANSQAQQPTTSGPQPIAQPWNNVLGSSNNTTPTASSIPTVQSIPTDALSTPSTAQPVSGIVDSTNPPPPGSTGFGSTTPTDAGGNSAKTPEQIMQQLQALQAQRQAAQQQSGATTNTNQTTAPATTTPPQ